MVDYKEYLYKAVPCAIILLVLYSIYCTGTYISTGTWPDGALFASVVGAVMLIFGFKGGIHFERKKNK